MLVISIKFHFTDICDAFNRSIVHQLSFVVLPRNDASGVDGNFSQLAHGSGERCFQTFINHLHTNKHLYQLFEKENAIIGKSRRIGRIWFKLDSASSSETPKRRYVRL